jgi:hypothetical protein
MIHKIDSFLIECDVCKKVYENGDGYTLFAHDLDNAHPEDVGWHVGEDDTEHKGKHYCSDCHHIDDEDNVIVHTPHE